MAAIALLKRWSLASTFASLAASAALLHKIPLANDNGLYYATVRMGGNDSTQVFNLSISSTVGYIVVAGDSCSSCASTALYNSTQSSTFQPAGNTPIGVDISGGSVATGTTAKETCGLKTDDSQWWTYSNQTIVVASGASGNSDTSALSQTSSGVLGLGISAVASHSDSFVGQWLSTHRNVSSLSVGLSLTSGSDSAMDIGTDPSSFRGNVTTVDLATPGDAQTPSAMGSSDWAVKMNGWTVSADSSKSVGGANAIAFIEPIVPSVVVPQTAAPTMFSLVGGSKLVRVDGNSSVWSIPCDTKYSLTFTFGGQNFTITESDLIVRTGTGCESAIRSWVDPSMASYVLGSAFIRNAYIIFNVSQGGIQTSSIGFAQPAVRPRSNKVGVVVGSVIGAMAGIVLLLGLGFYLLRRRGARRAASASYVPAVATEARYVDTPPGSALPTGNSLYVPQPGDFAAQQEAARLYQHGSLPPSPGPDPTHSAATPMDMWVSRAPQT
ncbi:hypothetical protein BOTBODRAFT_180913 [Botryobasidium botryosum FD-172 SS1]|uniref:Peptidase A1 domain-containing protein n=1 Tax=Botryobasidium botryosum (strain FD-172 SS1) TaxID=930990 RepID=A0A067M6D9_BOTB1|nr:hypothetical protein BOTBODRAFT_180913 [Botryobasidium botryosum FD-172 SS1]